jgi:hypothetical protein
MPFLLQIVFYGCKVKKKTLLLQTNDGKSVKDDFIYNCFGLLLVGKGWSPVSRSRGFLRQNQG